MKTLVRYEADDIERFGSAKKSGGYTGPAPTNSRSA